MPSEERLVVTAPLDNTIDLLLRELVPGSAEGRRPDPRSHPEPGPGSAAGSSGAGWTGAVGVAGGAGAGRPSSTPPTRRPSRWRWLATAAAAVAVAVAAFSGGLLVGHQRADAPAGDPAAAPDQLGSAPVEPGQPLGTASTSLVAGDAQGGRPAELVTRYREALAARDLVSTQLTDADLTRFGYAACVFAASAQGPTDFDTFRSAAIADAQASLSDAEMAVVIDTAVTVFCPADAARLGIGA